MEVESNYEEQVITLYRVSLYLLSNEDVSFRYV